jgi:hypothetical protein
MKAYKFIFFLSFCFFCIHEVSSQDLTGVWTGYLDQSKEASKMKVYKMYWDNGLWKKGKKTHVLRLTFKYNEKKKNYTGEYYINETVNKAHYAKFYFRSTFSNKKARYTTTSKIFETQNTLNTSFCHSSATLNYSEDIGYEYLEGEWRGWSDNSKTCAPAHVRVRRKKPGYVEPEPPVIEEKKDTTEQPEIIAVEKIDTVVEMNIETKTVVEQIPDPVEPVVEEISSKNRKLITKETMHVPKDSILLQIWDSNRVDGDIISLDLNGVSILKEYSLTSIPKSIKIQLVTGENIITMFAHNLGDIPPNTAAISVEREFGYKTIILKSDIGQSESIKIIKE